MSELSQSKLMVALSLEAEAAKASAEKMPLHVTVTPPFSIGPTNLPLFLESSDRVASSIPGFSIVGGQEAYFGEDHSMRVRKIGSSTLVAVHEAFFELAHQFDDTIDQTFAAGNYSAHSTYQGEKGFAEGQKMDITSVDIYEKIGKMWRVNHTSLFGTITPPELTQITVIDGE